MSRDRQKDMELCQRATKTESGLTEFTEADNGPEMTIYWLQQYAAEKERADQAQQGYLKLRKLYDEQCSEKMEYYNEMVVEKERANKLITKIRKLMVTNNFGPLVVEDLNFAILSLYPKEETKP